VYTVTFKGLQCLPRLHTQTNFECSQIYHFLPLSKHKSYDEVVKKFMS
jgi:hypothetical protein